MAWLIDSAIKWTVHTYTTSTLFSRIVKWLPMIRNRSLPRTCAPVLLLRAALFDSQCVHWPPCLSVCFYSHKKDRTQDLAWRIAGVSSKLKINDSIQFFLCCAQWEMHSGHIWKSEHFFVTFLCVWQCTFRLLHSHYLLNIKTVANNVWYISDSRLGTTVRNEKKDRRLELDNHKFRQRLLMGYFHKVCKCTQLNTMMKLCLSVRP